MGSLRCLSELVFTVPGEPKGRVHTTSLPVRRRNGSSVYRSVAKGNPQQKAWVAAVREGAWQAMQEAGWEKIEQGAIRLSVLFVMPRPQQFCWKKPHAEPRCWKGLDLTNLLKALEDALTGIIWRNDSQIAEYGKMVRRYARLGEQCCAVVTVDNLGEWMPEIMNEEAKNGQVRMLRAAGTTGRGV